MTGFLTLDRVAFRYGATPILKEVSLRIAEGEMHVLLGPSGCGKTTLLRAIAGLQPIDGGEIALAGRRIDRLPPAARNLAMVFQHYALFPNMNVRENLAFGLTQRRLTRAVIADRVERILDTVDLTAHADKRPAQLSGGQRQRVALARALVLAPDLLLLDEPLSALDAQIRKKLQLELRRLQRDRGVTSILVTHDQEEALFLGDRISVLCNGRIEQTGTGREMFYRPSTLFVAQFLGKANILPLEKIRPGAGAGYIVVQPSAFQATRPLHPGPLQPGLTLEGRVIDSQLLGSFMRVNIVIGDLEIQMEQRTDPHAPPPTPGSAISVWAHAADVHRLDASGRAIPACEMARSA